MTKSKVILTLIAAIFTLFSYCSLAESYKICEYFHEEYKLVNGVKIYDYDGDGINEGIPYHKYAFYQVGYYEACPDEPPALPNHSWTPIGDPYEDNDVSYVSLRTEGDEECLAHRISLSHSDELDIQ